MTEEQREMVKAMACVGVPHEAIAKVFGVHKTTLQRHLHVELETGQYHANATVAKWLFAQIVGTGDAKLPPHDRMVAAFFWLKCRAGWKDTQSLEIVRPLAEMSREELDARLGMIPPDQREAIRNNIIAMPKPKR